ncbi:MAG TPA: DUF1549 domain-containing protein [Planctomycetaceae bacterium]|nr:DUF1549 domain-containing protein [Planctomycetaceae bacterium]
MSAIVLPRALAVGVICVFAGTSLWAEDVPARMTPPQLDALIERDLKSPLSPVLNDEQFLRRVTLDLAGRQPTPDEVDDFMASTAADKRAQAIERLLADPAFGRNWADYWSDTIAYRIPPPELTFLNYDPFKSWMASQLNENVGWDQTIRDILAASGKVKDNPPATFVAYHEAHPQRLASETARIFLSLQLGCAQCHDHPFDDWKREQFHELAAYFTRASVKFPWNEGIETEVKDKGKGEYEMPNVQDPTKKGTEMAPAFLTGEKLPKGKSDVERRKELSQLIASEQNPWFAKSYVNRVWARLMGRGFFEPVDDFGPAITPELPGVHEALSTEFRVSGHDVKAFFRLVMNTQAYQQELPVSASTDDRPFSAGATGKLRGDEIFASLVTAIDLPNVTPPKMAPTKEIRFPPPPKSTRDLVAEAFAFDPSARVEDVSRTLQQAMLLMNNDQLQKQVDARPESGTVLAKLLKEEGDNRAAVEQLFQLLLARKPRETELKVTLEHVSSVSNRGEAFEDVLWSLINSAEFTTRR